jgi:hypothetical protein
VYLEHGAKSKTNIVKCRKPFEVPLRHQIEEDICIYKYRLKGTCEGKSKGERNLVYLKNEKERLTIITDTNCTSFAPLFNMLLVQRRTDCDTITT